jgi:endoribonuclease Dicer
MTNTAQKVYGTMSFEEIIDSIWRLEVPKALSDVVEALLGAVFVDSGWQYDVVRKVVMRLFDNVLEYVHPNMPADPASEFMLWVARYGCTQVKYK